MLKFLADKPVTIKLTKSESRKMQKIQTSLEGLELLMQSTMTRLAEMHESAIKSQNVFLDEMTKKYDIDFRSSVRISAEEGTITVEDIPSNVTDRLDGWSSDVVH